MTDSVPGGTERSTPHRRIAVPHADTLLGEAVTRDVLLRGLDVLSIAEDAGRVARISPTQRILAADVRGEDLSGAFEDVDTVVLPLAPDGDRVAVPTDAELVTGVVRSMRRAGIRRVVASSSLDLTGAAADPVLGSGLGSLGRSSGRTRHLLDLRHCEMLLAGSGADWTVLRAGRLTELLGTRSPTLLRADAGQADPRARRIPREDLARALVDAALAPGSAPRVRAVASDG